MVSVNQLMRTDRDFRELVNFIKAKFIMAGKKVPSNAKITKMIARNINKEDLLRNEFIKL